MAYSTTDGRRENTASPARLAGMADGASVGSMRPGRSPALQGKKVDGMTTAASSARRIRNGLGLRYLVPCVVLLAVGAATAVACSVPVFRYALERWAPDDYRLIVFHDGALDSEAEGWVRDLGRDGLAGKPAANLAVRTVDLAAKPVEPELLRWWQQYATITRLPAMVLLYPAGLRLPEPAWIGPLTGATVAQLLDSPLRREIGRRLLGGESAVWVLVESGDGSADTQAAELLERRLRHLEETMELPELDPADLREEAPEKPAEKLKVDFSMLRVSRQDPEESVLVGMLLGLETDLAERREPIVFPIFGQGRVLYALVGRGISNAMIDEAAGFLTGACSCVVKEENPGSDLLMAVDWDRLVEPLIASSQEVPALAGIAGFTASQAVADARSRVPAAAQPATSVQPGPSAAVAAAAAAGSGGARSAMVHGLMWVGGLGAMILLAVTWWLLRQRG